MNKYLLFVFSLGMIYTYGQTPRMDFENYNPPSTLVVPEHKLTKAKFPFIDVHNHQEDMPDMNLGTLITDMDKLNMKVMVNLTGRNGDALKKSVKNMTDFFSNGLTPFKLSNGAKVSKKFLIKELGMERVSPSVANRNFIPFL